MWTLRLLLSLPLCGPGAPLGPQAAPGLPAGPATQAAPAAPAVARQTARGLPDLRQRMADPTWFSRPPSTPWWSLDGARLYFERPVAGQGSAEVFELDLASGVERALPEAERHAVAPRRASWNAGRSAAVYARGGDLYLWSAEGPEPRLRQLTRTSASESNPSFTADGAAVLFETGGARRVLRLADGFVGELPELDLETTEDEEEPEGFLEESQARLMRVLSERRERDAAREAERERLFELDPDRVPPVLHLGDLLDLDGLERIELRDSPNLGWSLLTAGKPRQAGERDAMPAYVTESSYVETSSVRPHVGVGERRAERLFLVDWNARTARELELEGLPMLLDDPLAALREAAEQRAEQRRAERDAESDAEGDADAQGGPERGEAGDEAQPAPDAQRDPDGEPDPDAKADVAAAQPKPRGLSISGTRWSPDGATLLLSLRSLDNKDRWLCAVEGPAGELRALHHLRDPAWIGWGFNEFDWLADGSGFWFLSEESGWSQLYAHELASGVTRRLTQGEFEVDRVTELEGQGALLARANWIHPGQHEVLRIALADGATTAVTALGARTDYVLDPGQTRVALRSSRTLAPEELFLKELAAPVAPRQLTFSTTPAFEAVAWIAPEHLELPSQSGRPIHARLYRPPADAPPPGPGGRPAVLFVHGAGYLQNAHFGWSGYFREFFFHDLLARSGVVVLDMDYRASAGYGRDWRTAIHLVMGAPELEDFEDGVAYLTGAEGVDPARIGIYGGSYGGFMTLMAMFRRPGLFRAGAALRSVTDWAHYNDGYTRNILETPELAPEAYRDASPIEWAEGLEGALLMCHGMLDDNVLAKDSIRLAQRLIELGKDGWELALYPMEPHGFREPSSWRDEYSRILALFERELGFVALDR